MGKYKKCPRCELNWIAGDEELCEVCKAELGKASSISLLEDDDDMGMEERICPVCKVNYLEPDEDICAACRAEQAANALEKSEEDAWQEFVDDEPIAEDEEETEVSLSQLQDEEYDESFEDEEEEESVDSEPDDFDTYGDVNDYEEDDEEEDDKDGDDF